MELMLRAAVDEHRALNRRSGKQVTQRAVNHVE
jgi:hypothetical protein